MTSSPLSPLPVINHNPLPVEQSNPACPHISGVAHSLCRRCTLFPLPHSPFAHYRFRFFTIMKRALITPRRRGRPLGLPPRSALQVALYHGDKSERLDAKGRRRKGEMGTPRLTCCPRITTGLLTPPHPCNRRVSQSNNQSCRATTHLLRYEYVPASCPSWLPQSTGCHTGLRTAVVVGCCLPMFLGAASSLLIVPPPVPLQPIVPRPRRAFRISVAFFNVRQCTERKVSICL